MDRAGRKATNREIGVPGEGAVRFPAQSAALFQVGKLFFPGTPISRLVVVNGPGWEKSDQSGDWHSQGGRSQVSRAASRYEIANPAVRLLGGKSLRHKGFVAQRGRIAWRNEDHLFRCGK